MPTDPVLGQHYRIRNKHTGQYISPERTKIGYQGHYPVMRNAYPKDEANDFAYRRQSWHVFPRDTAKRYIDRCMIVNAAGGDILAPHMNPPWAMETYLRRETTDFLHQQTPRSSRP
jgi:hypothetical protein